MLPRLLPPNRSPFETAMEAVAAERFPLPAHLVASVLNPDTCPAPLLAFLAWSLSVDLWDDRWPETKQREVCRKALLLHQIKTTVAGIRAHLELVGAQLRHVTRPPGTGFLRGVMSEEQRIVWLDSLPQVRIYPFFTRAIAKHRLFSTGAGVRHQFHGRGWLRDSRGASLLGRRATYFDRGVETPVTITGLEGGAVEQLLLGGRPRPRMWHGTGFGRGNLTRSTAALNVVTVRASSEAETFAIARGVEPVDVRPQRIAQQRVAPAARSFFGRRGGFHRSSHGPMLIYDRIALNDPARLGARRKVRSWHGRGRFGIPEFTAELKIKVPMERSRRRSGRWHGVGFRKAADMTPLHKAIEAVRVSKAFRDTVLIDTVTHRKAEFGSGLRFGEFHFGQIREVA